MKRLLRIDWALSGPVILTWFHADPFGCYVANHYHDSFPFVRFYFIT